MTISYEPWCDITYAINEEMPVWPEQPRTTLGRAESMEEGGVANVTILEMSMHSGTHIDAPCHFLKDGSDIQAMPLRLMSGAVRLVSIEYSANQITKTALQRYESRAGKLEPDDRVLFRSRNSDDDLMGRSDFVKDYAAVSPDAAQFLVERKVSLVGVDYLSVAPFDDPETTHRTLLDAGVWVIEGLDLRAVGEGAGELMIMPLKIEGSDASPARALFRKRI